MNKTNQELLDSYFQGRASDEEVAELEQRMLADADLRQHYLQEAMCETDLRSLALREENVITHASSPSEIVAVPDAPYGCGGSGDRLGSRDDDH